MSTSASKSNTPLIVSATVAAAACAVGAFLFWKSSSSSPASSTASATATPVVATAPAPQQQQEQQEQQQPAKSTESAPVAPSTSRPAPPPAPTLRPQPPPPKMESLSSSAPPSPPPVATSSPSPSAAASVQSSVVPADIADDVNRAFADAFADTLMDRDWNESLAVLRRASELLPVAEQCWTGRAAVIAKFNAEIAARNDLLAADAAQGPSMHGDDDDEPKKQPEPLLDAAATPARALLERRMYMLRTRNESERFILAELLKIVQRNSDTVLGDAFEQMENGSEAKQGVCKKVRDEILKVQEWLGKLHLPPAEREKLARNCADILSVVA